MREIHFWTFWLTVGATLHISAALLHPKHSNEEVDLWSLERYIGVYLLLVLVGAWWWGSAVAWVARAMR